VRWNDALVRGRDTLVHKAYGKADLENDVAATPAHVYRIGSITKQFTAAGVMRLVEQGKVSLDDDFTKYVPFDTRGRRVTVRHLLDHTSGIRSYTSVGERWARRWREDMTPDTIVAMVARDSFDFEPGADWRYNNTGYVLLGMLIEKVSGRPYAAFVEEELFKPLGLASTSYCETKPLIPRRAHGYARGPQGFENAPYLSMSQPYAAGSLCSTTRDLVRWNDALVRGRVVSPASYALMAGPSTQKDGTPIKNGYGFGLGMGKFGERRAVAHSGGIHGFAADMAWLPDDSVLVVALTNAGSPAAGRLIRLAAAAALGDPLPGAPRATLTEADRQRYVGSYRLATPDGGTMDVRVWSEGGQLRAHPAGQGQLTLVPQGDHAFLDSSNPNIAIRFTLEGARAAKLTVTQGGRTMEAPRIP
jgi:D-alanyl-D-alanine carboxypeptidase